MATTMANEQAVRRLFEEISAGNMDVIDQIVAPDYQLHPLIYQPVPPPGAENASGREIFKAIMTMNRRQVPDMRYTIEKLVPGDDYVTVVVRSDGHRDGQSVTGHAISLYRFTNGTIAEGWTMVDRLGTFQQLHIVPDTLELQRKAGMRS